MDVKPNVIDVIGKEILNYAQDKPNGLSNEELVEVMPNITQEQRVNAVNKLIQQGQIEILKKNNSLLYRIKDPTKKSVVPKGADNEEKIVYSIIEEGGNKGIWIRDIRVKSNLIMTQLNKILKNLENKKLIKAVKSVNASKKKVYMLFNLEPDRSVTGGAWYQDQDFEAEFVDVLNQQSLRFLQMRKTAAKELKEGPLAAMKFACCSVQDVHKFISELGISKVNLDEDDLETILKTVVYDGKAERIVQMDGKSLYRAIDSPLVTVPGLVQMPCGICPIIKNCSTTGEVTPKSCQYMTEWLE
ncbi:probable DNA-directed RNA polymerase III subunit RPC6 [Bradysia coprophila]|uniref:probable DNA-directed RNA polymerase III subunit RPC6 n=1 Tax=Bradysia coprophila TaxID=38358 RepID=UPI00187D7946|nr:probable DNA-directed RNA polymerase III subunit RPC6 [Bradysia coprophila]